MDERMKRVSRRQKAAPLAICSRDICAMIFVEDSFADSLLFSRATDNTKLMPRFNYNGQKFVYYPRNNRCTFLLTVFRVTPYDFPSRVRSSDSKWNTCSCHIVTRCILCFSRNYERVEVSRIFFFFFLFKNCPRIVQYWWVNYRIVGIIEMFEEQFWRTLILVLRFTRYIEISQNSHLSFEILGIFYSIVVREIRRRNKKYKESFPRESWNSNLIMTRQRRKSKKKIMLRRKRKLTTFVKNLR